MERQGNALQDDIPLVLAREGQHGPIIHATNRAAQQLQINRGSRVVDMRAIYPDLQVEYADEAGDQAALDRLVLWTRRWCPWTARDNNDGLLLDTTGSDHLLGGEAAMLIEMETQFSLLGLTSRLAVAPTWGAAWALARFGPARSICDANEIHSKLSTLPVTGLRLESETVLLLKRLGLKTIGDIMEVPRLSLARRFVNAKLKTNPLMRLDQALGKLAEPISSVEASPRFRVQSSLAEPIFDPTPYLLELCETLCDKLAKAGMGCRKLHLTVYKTDGDVSNLDVATSALSRDPQHLCNLFHDKIERINPGYGFDLITLEASAVEQIPIVQNLLNGGADDDLQLAQLLDRLSAKFGPQAISRPIPNESHIPERAQGQKPALTPINKMGTLTTRERPLRLLDHPEEVRVLYSVPEGPPAQFVWRKQTHRVTRYNGPERIAPEWWKDRPSTRLRDYFKIENQTGQRIWLYREGLHEDGRGGPPRWFVHGCFA